MSRRSGAARRHRSVQIPIAKRNTKLVRLRIDARDGPGVRTVFEETGANIRAGVLHQAAAHPCRGGRERAGNPPAPAPLPKQMFGQGSARLRQFALPLADGTGVTLIRTILVLLLGLVLGVAGTFGAQAATGGDESDFRTGAAEVVWQEQWQGAYRDCIEGGPWWKQQSPEVTARRCRHKADAVLP